MDKEFYVFAKRVGRYRGVGKFVMAPSVKELEGPLRQAFSGITGMEQATITISDIASDDGSFSGQFDYGLLGEFTVTPS
jgi:hypothetical protein